MNRGKSLVSGSQSPRVEGGQKYLKFVANLDSNGEHQILILVFKSTLLALHDQRLEIGEQLLDCFEIVGLKRNQFILQNVVSQLIMLSK